MPLGETRGARAPVVRLSGVCFWSLFTVGGVFWWWENVFCTGRTLKLLVAYLARVPLELLTSNGLQMWLRATQPSEGSIKLNCATGSFLKAKKKAD